MTRKLHHKALDGNRCPCCGRPIEDVMANGIGFKSGMLYYQSKEIHLSHQMAGVFQCLWEHRGKVTTREELWNFIYPITSDVNSKIFDVYLTKVRTLIKHHKLPIHVRTVWGRGWMLLEGKEA